MFKCSNVLNPPITTYPNPPQNTVGKKAPKMRRAPLQASQLLNNDIPQNTVGKKSPKMSQAPLQAPQPLNYHIPQSTSKHSGQKGFQKHKSSLTSVPTL